MAVTNIAELNALVERVKKAQREYASFTQEQVDKSSAPLWPLQMLESLSPNGRSRIGMGIVEDKVIKTTSLPNTFTTLIKTKNLWRSVRRRHLWHHHYC